MKKKFKMKRTFQTPQKSSKSKKKSTKCSFFILKSSKYHLFVDPFAVSFRTLLPTQIVIRKIRKRRELFPIGSTFPVHFSVVFVKLLLFEIKRHFRIVKISVDFELHYIFDPDDAVHCHNLSAITWIILLKIQGCLSIRTNF